MPMQRNFWISDDDNFVLLANISHSLTHAAHHTPSCSSAITLLHEAQQIL